MTNLLSLLIDIKYVIAYYLTMLILDHLHNWRGTASELGQLLVALVPALGLGGEPPTERTLRYWRTDGFLSRSERRFTEREALEALNIHALQQQGLKLGAIHAQVRSCTLEELRKRLEPSIPD